jgi:hypothetical protein
VLTWDEAATTGYFTTAVMLARMSGMPEAELQAKLELVKQRLGLK